MLPGARYDLCCGITVVASDQPAINSGWASASWERRKEIVAEHTYFEMGTFYYLANDPKVPAAIRQNYMKYGLCKDEFQECKRCLALHTLLVARLSPARINASAICHNSVLCC